MSKSTLIVRPAAPADYPSIAALLDKTFGPRPYQQRLKLWQWRYDANPVRIDRIPGFLVGEQDGEIVGVHGLVPLKMKLGEKVVTASCSSDLAVDPSARSAGMKIKLKALSKEISELHISTSANVPANQITLALGGKEVAVGRRKFIKPLKASGFIKRNVSVKAGSMLGGISGAIIGIPGNWYLAFTRGMTHYASVTGARLVDIDRFDSRFDRLWESISTRWPIAVIRDSEYLNWRYAQYPFSGVQSFALVRQDELLAYTVIHASKDSDGNPFVTVLELVAPEGEQEALEHILGEIVKRSVAVSAESITIRTLVPQFEAILSPFGFQTRTMEYSPVTYKNNSGVPEDLFDKESNWYLSMGDGDGCFYFD